MYVCVCMCVWEILPSARGGWGPHRQWSSQRGPASACVSPGPWRSLRCGPTGAGSSGQEHKHTQFQHYVYKSLFRIHVYNVAVKPSCFIFQNKMAWWTTPSWACCDWICHRLVHRAGYTSSLLKMLTDLYLSIFCWRCQCIQFSVTQELNLDAHCSTVTKRSLLLWLATAEGTSSGVVTDIVSVYTDRQWWSLLDQLLPCISPW